MEREIPIYFETVIMDSPIQQIQLNNEKSDAFRLKVGVFYKYKNRNYSYITDEYANYLIESAVKGNVPVVGFFDKETQAWASHTGPTLANGYGYVENFVGWEPFTDKDGVTRDYAVFSVVLFTDYYEEAQKIIGMNQSMELNPETIQGDWANFEGEDYFVYTQGKMFALCVIGAHEPCFSVSSFFSKNDKEYKNQYEKFSSLLSNLKAVVEEAEQKNKGGEQQMDEFEKIVEVEETPAAEVKETFEVAEENPVVEETPVQETFEEIAPAEETVAEEPIPDFEALYNELQNSYNTLQEQFNTCQNELNTMREENETLKNSITNYETQIATYAAQAAEMENTRKKELIDQYSAIVDTAEIESARENINTFSYEALESKLAIAFAKKNLSDNQSIKVAIPEQESSFASLMKNYKK